MLKKLDMQENQISEITEGDFEGLSKFNSDYDYLVSTHLTDTLLCAFLLAQTAATYKAVKQNSTVSRCYHAHNLT
jgi:Leucine-rich repeat (LRR) protein